jgi:hypothetical protein
VAKDQASGFSGTASSVAASSAFLRRRAANRKAGIPRTPSSHAGGAGTTLPWGLQSLQQFELELELLELELLELELLELELVAVFVMLMVWYWFWFCVVVVWG